MTTTELSPLLARGAELRLRARRNEILAHRYDRPIIEPIADAMDQAIAIEQRDRTAADRAREAGELHRIEQALEAIREGRYGVCECGDRISEKRLAALPHALDCLTCASMAEEMNRQIGRQEVARG